MKIFDLETVDSTNTYAWEMAKEMDGPFVVFAKEQTAGKGSRGRSWKSEEGNFYGSFYYLVTPDLLDFLPFISLIVGIKVVKVLERLKVPVQIQWPNDLVIPTKNYFNKVGGILCETKSSGKMHELVIGIGINLKEVSGNFEKPAGFVPIDLTILKTELLRTFDDNFSIDSLKEFQRYDFFLKRKIQDQFGNVGFGLGPDFKFFGYRFGFEDKEFLISDPDRPKLVL